MLQALIADEEKRPVLFDGASDRASVRIHLEGRPRDATLVVPEGVGVQSLVSETVGCRTVEFIGAALGRHRNNTLAPAVLRRVIIDGGPHFQNAVRIGHRGHLVPIRAYDAAALK